MSLQPAKKTEAMGERSMIQDSPELVALKHALGRQLAALREAAEIGQQQVARKTGYSRSSVAHAEAGRQLLTHDFWTTADELVNAEGALLASYERVQAAKQEHEARSREAELARAYAEAQAHAQALRATASPSPLQNGNGLAMPTGQELVSGLVASLGAELASGLGGPLLYLAFLSSATQAVPIEWRDQLREQLRTFLQEWANTVERREHLRLLGWVATAVAASRIISLDSDEQERLDKAITTPNRVDAQVIWHIETMLRHCQQQEDSLGPQAVLHTILAQRDLALSLLDECLSELRPRLLSVYSNMSSAAGYQFFDLDDPISAVRYSDQARAAAQEARNTELAIYALCNMSYFASWQGKAHAGIDFAAAAQNLANKTDDRLLQVYAAERAASAYAVDGQHKESMVEFDRALEGLEHRPAGLPPSTVYWVHEGLIVSRQSDCLLRLGKPSEAAASAERGLELYDSSFISGRAFCTLRLGTARLLSGEVAEAAQVIGEGALLAARIRSARLIGEVKAARARMQPWQHTRAVRELDEKLVACGMDR
ncbi:MAG: helix-turn-helix domain-containing protein [Acidobacteria bacterium]|nr:helix-turn-helix domain-containing protein [Acidobacteriota bacterium]